MKGYTLLPLAVADSMSPEAIFPPHHKRHRFLLDEPGIHFRSNGAEKNHQESLALYHLEDTLRFHLSYQANRHTRFKDIPTHHGKSLMAVENGHAGQMPCKQKR